MGEQVMGKGTGPRWGMRKKKMMIVTVLGVVLLTTSTALPWWGRSSAEPAQSASRKTIIQLTGTAGADFSGYYICKGKRTTVCGVLPSTFSGSRISQCEFRKTDRDDVLVLQVRDGNSYLHYAAPAGTRGLKAATTAGGWNAGALRK